MIIKCDNKKYVNLYGRIYKKVDSYYFDNSNSTLEFNIIGSYVKLNYKANCSIGTNKIRVYIDDNDYLVSLPNTDTFNDFILVNNLENKPHHIKIVKVLEDQYSRIVIHHIETEKFVRVNRKPKLKIEFYGDSLTCGFGILGNETSINSEVEDSTKSFAYLTANTLNANYSCLCYSGIGTVYKGYFPVNIQEIYNMYSYSSKLPYKNNFKANVIVVYICTNDQQAVLEDNTKLIDFENNLKEFISKIKEYNKTASIIMCYGMCKLIESVDNTVIKVSKMFEHTYSCKFYPNDIASIGHPGVKANKDASNVLINLIKTII